MLSLPLLGSTASASLFLGAGSADQEVAGEPHAEHLYARVPVND